MPGAWATVAGQSDRRGLGGAADPGNLQSSIFPALLFSVSPGQGWDAGGC